MKRYITQGIVLTRVNYQEADRIVTILTPDYGKVRVLAKGVRKSGSKLAGGLELFSLSEIGFLYGRGELATLTSSRLLEHFATIAHDINRTMLGYELIKLLHKATEEEPGPDYFALLKETLAALDDALVQQELIRLWFYAQLLKLAGHTPNLRSDLSGNALDAYAQFIFSFEDMGFNSKDDGPYTADHIKLLRLAFSQHPPATLQKVQGIDGILPASLQLVQTILPNHIHAAAHNSSR